jgi:ABC-2 type transport system permease protein
MLGVRIATEVGNALPRLAACIAGGALVSSIIAGAPPRATAALLAVPALVIAVVANITAQHAFAAVAFWIRDARSTWFLYHKLVFILGGMLLPIEVLPSSISRPAKLLPFASMAYVPARLASGHLDVALIALQLAWLVVLGAVAVAAFEAGQRRLQVVGG